MAGALLSDYRIFEPIGTGGMGIVFRAEDIHLKRQVALKFLAGEFAGEAQARTRFLREARTAAALNHPNICTIHAVGEAEADTEVPHRDGRTAIPAGAPFLSMELIPGTTLRAQLDAQTPVLAQLLEIAIQIGEGLAVAHTHRIVHRDLKPGNVMVTNDGRVKILDFGLAKAVRPRTEDTLTATGSIATELTRPGVVVGTYPYMSPEQAEGKKIDHRSDLFSFGTILYEMASGSNPFAAETATATSANILKMDPEPPSNAHPQLPEQLDRIVSRCLRKRPAERYQDARELVADLKRLRRSVERGSARPPRRALQRRLRPRIALAAATFLLVMAGAYSLWNWSSSRVVIDSLAVLPVTDLSGNPDQTYLSAGITDGLISELSQIPGLRVISRHTMMQYENTHKTLQEIARELNVESLLEASLTHQGDQLRLSARLVQTEPEKAIWAESYERELAGVMSLYADVARTIAGEVRASLTPDAQRRLARVRPVDPEAYQAVVKGRYHLYKFTEEAIEKALGYFREAIELDPTSAHAYAGLADVYSWQGQFGYQEIGEASRRAKAAATKALELDDSLAEPHAALGRILLQYEWDWSGARRELERTLAINPNSVDGLYYYAYLLLTWGEYEQAIAQARKLAEVDPLTYTSKLHFAYTLFYGRQPEAAIAYYQAMLEEDPEQHWTHTQLAWVYSELNMHEEAVAECEAALRHPPDQIVAGSLGGVLAKAGRHEEARELLDQLLEMPPEKLDAYNVGILYHGFDDTDETMKWINRAYEERSPSVFCISFDYMTERLQSDERCQALLEKLRLPIE